jgi:hypothetical protein
LRVTRSADTKGVAKDAVKVIYIMGAGHIGSTIVDVVLGHHDRLESLGEIIKFHRFGWEDDDRRRCSCGETVFSCPFWSRVKARWARMVDDDGAVKQLDLQRRFEDSHLSWLRLLSNGLSPGSTFKRYQDGTQALLRVVQETGGKDVLVDSSLRPRRAMALSLNPNIELYLIHMVRDGRGVMWSLMKPNKQTTTRTYTPAPPMRVIRYWISANLQSTFVFNRVRKDRRLLMRYEDFAIDPSGTLARIGELVGMDFSRLLVGPAVTPTESQRHTVGGNRVRMQKSIEIRSDFAWKEHLQERHKKLFWRTAGWLAKRYGYQEQ